MSIQKIQEGRRWYIIHTYPGEEEMVAKNLKQRVENLSMEDKIFNVIVPKEKKLKLKMAKEKLLKKKFTQVIFL
jgi:transcriptional antiterminator NusG